MNVENPRLLRILVICAGRIERPRTGGELRIHHLFRELAALGHEVDLHAFVARNYPTCETRPAERFRVRLRHSVWLDLALVADRAGLVPITELPVWLYPLRGLARRLAGEGGYDVVHFESPWFAALERAVTPPARVVYSAHNVEWVWWRRTLLRRPLGRWWRGRLHRHELAALAAAHGVVGCSQADCRWLARGAGRVTLVPNGFDARTVRPASKDERDALRRRHGFRPDERIAVFLGSDVPPNRQAAEFILRRLAPATRGQPLRHVIAGRVAEHLSHAPDNVQLLGALPETLTLLQAADLGLNPIATGSGSNIKLAEYCAAGLGVVTTPFGLRGLEGLRPLVRVAALEDFPAAVLDARHPDRLPPAEILEPYAWQTGARRLEAFYRELIGGASGQRTMTVAGRAAVDGLG